ncbi:hypothetical protein NDQ53_14345 [Rossellomorea marisflavi]|uniref:hypothetical protein n=1 Tax=Rossellomorea marisflavi TaxID=189381 RepID=UPI00203A5D05|nr:hypothetical protein [Rossellomorea marisflavi]MCM2590479.1 hypothetical protein [Rossellomorea marisflavi]
MNKKLQELGVANINVWILHEKGFVFVTPLKDKEALVRSNLKEIGDTAYEENREMFCGISKRFYLMDKKHKKSEGKL